MNNRLKYSFWRYLFFFVKFLKTRIDKFYNYVHTEAYLGQVITIDEKLVQTVLENPSRNMIGIQKHGELNISPEDLRKAKELKKNITSFGDLVEEKEV